VSARLRGAIAGCGFFAQFHIEAWRRMEDVELVAACDPDLGRARAAAPRAYGTLEELLAAETLDFVDIATRPEAHVELVRMAIGRRLPVICQKPMAPTLAEAIEMARDAESSGARVMIHENWRWQPWYRQAKARIEAGEIGDPVTYRFRIRKRDGAGPEPYLAQPYFRQMPRLLIHETMVHPIDTARFLFGGLSTVSARASRRNPIVAGEDGCQLVLAHDSGLAGIADGNRFVDLAPDSPPLGDAEFEGERGVLRVEANGDVTRNGERVWRNEVLAGYRGDSVLATQRHFVDCLRTGAAFETSAAEYLLSFAAVEAAYRSAADGGREVAAGRPEILAS
jgi:D-apiose dehydrogenase